MNKEELIKNFATRDLGVDLIGICRAQPAPREAMENLQKYIEKGHHGDMAYLENTALRGDPEQLLPGAKSIIVIGLNYYREKPETPPDRGRISRYAWGRDYHKVFKGVLKQMQGFLEEKFPGHQHKMAVDSAPLMEKVYAREAGIGFYGKNCMLISPDIGSFFLLGELITTLELEADAPREAVTKGTCGTCTRCLDACPTKALVAPGKIDARRCISYLTIETRAPIPDEHSTAAGNLIMGCDICQEVCPYNKACARPATHPAFTSGAIAGDEIPLAEILQITTDEQFLQRFAGSPAMRPKREGMIKNAINAAANALRHDPAAYGPELVPLIENIAQNDSSPSLRGLAGRTLKGFRSC